MCLRYMAGFSIYQIFICKYKQLVNNTHDSGGKMSSWDTLFDIILAVISCEKSKKGEKRAKGIVSDAQCVKEFLMSSYLSSYIVVILC